MIKSFSLVYGGVAQLARAPALQAGGHRFDSDILHHFLYLQTAFSYAKLLMECSSAG